jgi:hypothetical protein
MVTPNIVHKMACLSNMKYIFINKIEQVISEGVSGACSLNLGPCNA